MVTGAMGTSLSVNRVSHICPLIQPNRATIQKAITSQATNNANLLLFLDNDPPDGWRLSMMCDFPNIQIYKRNVLQKREKGAYEIYPGIDKCYIFER